MGKLTAMGVKNLTEPGRYSDGEGLILKLAAKGKGSWIVRIQADGKRRDFGLGPLYELPLADAREAARALRKEVKAGVDVLAEREKETLVIPTFSDAAKLVHEENKAAWKNGKHQAQWIKTLETYAFPTLGDKLVSDIEGPAIRDALSPIWLTKPETASASFRYDLAGNSARQGRRLYRPRLSLIVSRLGCGKNELSG